MDWEAKEMDKIPVEVLEAVKKAAPEGRLTCAAAHELAKKLGVDPCLIGQAANATKVKIKKCQLGCF
jgi:hypothetical protein